MVSDLLRRVKILIRNIMNLDAHVGGQTQLRSSPSQSSLPHFSIFLFYFLCPKLAIYMTIFLKNLIFLFYD